MYYTMAPGRQGEDPEVQPVPCPLCVCWEKGAPFSDAMKAQHGPSVLWAGPATPDSWTALVLPLPTASPCPSLYIAVPKVLAFLCSEQPC